MLGFGSRGRDFKKCSKEAWSLVASHCLTSLSALVRQLASAVPATSTHSSEAGNRLPLVSVCIPGLLPTGSSLERGCGTGQPNQIKLKLQEV